MKQNFCLIALCLVVFTIPFAAQAQTAPSGVAPAKTESAQQSVAEKLTAEIYQSLLDKLKKGDTAIDYRKLRFSFAETKDYSPKGVDKEIRDKAVAAFNEKKYKETLDFLQNILKTDFVDMYAHLFAYLAHKELGNTKEADFHSQVLNGLYRSIANSGDGKTTKTAYVVIRVDEEYAFLLISGLRRTTQELVKEDNHFYDLFTVADSKTQQPIGKIYFNVDKAFEGYDKMVK